MVVVSEETVFPFPKEKVWRLIELHMDDQVVRKIHPGILSSRQLSREGDVWAFERSMRTRRRTFTLKWRFELKPMESLREEVISSTGGIAPGSFLENSYSAVGDSTKVSTRGNMILMGVPGFLQGRLLKGVFSNTDKEDLRYLASLNPRNHRTT